MVVPIYSNQEQIEVIVAQAVEVAYNHESLCRLLYWILSENYTFPMSL